MDLKGLFTSVNFSSQLLKCVEDATEESNMLKTGAFEKLIAVVH